MNEYNGPVLRVEFQTDNGDVHKKILETLNNPVTVRAMLQDLKRISDDSVRREQGEVAPDVRKSFEKLLNALEKESDV